MKFLGRLLALLVITVACQAQIVNNGGNGGAGVVFVTSDPSGACTNQTTGQFNYLNGKLWNCVAGTWTQTNPSAGSGAPGGGNGTLQFNSSSSFGGVAQWSSNGTTTLTGSATAILNLSAMPVLTGLSLPQAAGAIPVTDGILAFNTTNHTLVYGVNGTTGVSALSATGTNISTTCTNQVVTVISGVAAPTCTSLTTAFMPSAVPTSVVNDTNVTGSIAANALTLGWTGTLAAGRLNANVVQAITNDTNITGSITAQNLTLGWTGTLAKGRMLGTVVYTDQANTYSTGLQDLSAATLRIPTGAGATASASSALIRDTTAQNVHIYANSADAIIGAITGSPANNDCVKFLVSAGNITLTTAGAACGSGGGSGTTFTLANAGTTGTTANTLTKLTGAPSTAVIAGTSDTGGVVGVCTSNCTTSGSATITFAGSVSLVFDGGTTAGHYVQISSSVAGNGHDAGATYPTSGQVIGRVLSTNVGAGTYTVDLFPAEIQSASPGNGQGVSTTFSAAATSGTLTHNFNSAVHVDSCIDANGTAVQWTTVADGANHASFGLGGNSDFFTFTGGLVANTTCTATIGGGPGGVSGVTSLSGDGTLISNITSSGVVTLTLTNAPAHKYWGNNTGSTAAPGYVSLVLADLPSIASTNLSDSALLVYNNAANTFTAAGTVNLSASTVADAFRTPAKASATAGATGSLIFDTTGKNYHGFCNSADCIIPGFSSAPTTGDVVSATVSSGNVLLSDAGFLATNVVRKDTTNTGAAAMTLDMSASTGASAFKVPVKAALTTAVNGGIGYDSTNNMLHAAQSTADAFIPQFTATPANNDCVKWVVSGSNYKLGTQGAACGTGGSITWDAIGNAAGALTLANGTNATTFNQTSAVAWTWANTTAAVVGTSQNSPVMTVCGTAFHASASVQDCLTLQDQPGAGNDAAITFAVAHTGSSTGTVTTTFPGPIQAGPTGGAGGSFTLPEGSAASASTGNDVCYGDSTLHGAKCSWNNGTFLPLPLLNGTLTSGGLAYNDATTNLLDSSADWTISSHTLTAGSSAILSLASAPATTGFLIPKAAGAAPTADGQLAFNTTTHALVNGSNGTTIVQAAAATGTNTSTTCTNQTFTVISSVAAPTCTTLTSSYLPAATVYNNATTSYSAVQTFPGGDFFMGGVNAQSGTTYTFVTGDENKLVTFNNASSIAVTLPQATTSGFTAGAIFYTSNRGAGTATITPTTSTINGGATLVLNQNQGAIIVSDGANYSAWISAAPTGSGTVTSVDGSFTGGLITISGSHPVTSSGTLAFIVAGTSGGIPYFSSSSTWASSAALPANVPVVGGGAGNAPVSGFATGSNGTITSGKLACLTSSNTMGNCTGTAPNNFIGVFNSSTTYVASGIVSVSIDATQNVTFGDILCASATSAGFAHDNGSNACTNGEWVGVVTTTASSVSSVTASLRLQ
jgi:hypothetical protein